MKESEGIRISRTLRISDIETYYDKLYAAKNKDPNLLVATSIAEKKIGNKAALCQFVNTWARVTNNNKLYTFINSIEDAEATLRNLCNEFYGLTSVVMSLYPKSRTIVSNDGAIDLTNLAKKIAKEHVSEMRKGEGDLLLPKPKSRGDKIMIACFDHLSYEYRFMPWFYKNKEPIERYPTVYGRTDFIELVGLLVNKIMFFSGQEFSKKYAHEESLKEFKESLGKILQELFKNTHDHAMHGIGAEKEETLRPNVRGIIMEHHFGSRDQLLSNAEGSDPLRSYFLNEQFSDQSKKMHFLEISVIDSGPGLAQRFLNQPLDIAIDIQHEYSTIMKCLSFGQTSDTSSISSQRGMGLPDVMELLADLGFMRIRSGRLSLYRDFIKKPFDKAEFDNEATYIKPSNELVKDWRTCSSELTSFQLATGTLITILFPIMLLDRKEVSQ